MKILVIGGGGREHAICVALSKDDSVTALHCAPGNPGIAQVAEPHPVDALDPASVTALAVELGADLVVVGPEAPLVAGVADAVRAAGIACFGPSKAAAQLEGSKAFSKDVMAAAGVPTAESFVCATVEEAERALDAFGPTYVVKDDALAAGKGVVVTDDREAALEHVRDCVSRPGGGRVVIEAFLDGPEVSLFAITDGTTVLPLQPAQDFKRIGDGDTGPNTGGMGAYTGDGLLSAEMEQWLLKNVAQRVVDEMALEGTPFHGILFCGMMMMPQADGTTLPMVLEFNTRFGDPETQAILVRLESDIVDLFEAAIDGTADRLAIRMRPGASVCVIAASGGYPGKYISGLPISGLDSVGDPDTVVFHSGTGVQDGVVVTAGGRVLGVTAVSRPTALSQGRASGGGTALWDALGKAYGALAGVSFEGMQFRGDIGWRALRDGL